MYLVLQKIGCYFGLVLVLAPGPTETPFAVNPQLQAAYNKMYDENFASARRTIKQYEATHPGNPMGPLSEAASYMLEQFQRTYVLEQDFFSPGAKPFGDNHHPSPDPTLERSFFTQLERTQQQASAAQNKSSHHVDAQLAEVLVMTLKADYEALIEGHGSQALNEIKAGTAKSNDILQVCGACTDAKLPSAIENYILGKQSGFDKMFLSLDGAQTNEQKGIRELREVASNGHYFKTYAKVLLAIAAKRANHADKAKRLISQLASEYPHNAFFRAALKSLS